MLVLACLFGSWIIFFIFRCIFWLFLLRLVSVFSKIIDSNPFLLRAVTTKQVVVILAIALFAWWGLVIIVGLDEAKAESLSYKYSEKGLVDSVSTKWVKLDKRNKTVYIPEITVNFTQPNSGEVINLRVVFVTDFGEYWGDSSFLEMDADKWASQQSITVKGSQGLEKEAELIVFQNQRVPPIMALIFNRDNQDSEPIIRVPVID